MIVSSAPVRITMGGGGTDLRSYYSKYGGFLIAAAINKYIYISANKRFYNSIRLSYSQTEIVDNVNAIKHRLFRETLKFLDIEDSIELISVADVPANCGLGTSSSFTVSLLNALHTYKKDFISQRQLAEEACHIEIDILGEPVGKQDQYVAAFGGIVCLTFDKDGSVTVEPLKIPGEALDQLETNILLFGTGIERSASQILVEQDEKSKNGDHEILDNLHQIKEIGLETRRVLEKGNIDYLGELLKMQWDIKKKRCHKLTAPFLDECYELACKNGAAGGKIIGAGGGGFFMFYCPNNEKLQLCQAMKKMGLKPMKFHFDFEGAKILANMKGS